MNLHTKLLDLDHTLSARLTIRQADLLRGLLAGIAHTGDSLLWIMILLGLWFAGERDFAARGAITMFVLVGIVAVLKLRFRRRRPSGERGKLYFEIDAHSFPSGHAARTAGLAVVLGTLNPPLGAALGVWAALVSFARVLLGIHYLSDVMVGIAIGVTVGTIVGAIVS